MSLLLALLLLLQDSEQTSSQPKTVVISGPLTMAASTEKKILVVRIGPYDVPTPPGNPKNPMRAVKIFFNEQDYYIHGTNQEDAIGYAAAHGCIRMAEADATD